MQEVLEVVVDDALSFRDIEANCRLAGERAQRCHNGGHHHTGCLFISSISSDCSTATFCGMLSLFHHCR
jgi:hypothetical protein